MSSSSGRSATRAGAVEVRFNGTPVLTLSGVDTQDTATADVDHDRSLGGLRDGSGAGGVAIDVDDVYLLDTERAVPTTISSAMCASIATGRRRTGTTSGWTREHGRGSVRDGG